MVAATRRGKGPPPRYLPTVFEIAVACERIQAGWSERDFLKRRYGLLDASREEIEELTEQVGWSAPMVNTENLIGEASELFVRV